jgi:hypothetical protein
MKKATVFLIAAVAAIAAGGFWLYKRATTKAPALLPAPLPAPAPAVAPPPAPKPAPRTGISLSDFDPTTSSSKYGGVVASAAGSLIGSLGNLFGGD